MSAVAVQRDRPRRSVLASMWAFVKRHVLTVYSILFFVYLLLPIAVVVLFSFNNPVGKFNYTWQGFTVEQLALLERRSRASRAQSSSRSRSP